jgi:hypothetical protein
MKPRDQVLDPSDEDATNGNGKLELIEEFRLVVTNRNGAVQYHECDDQDYAYAVVRWLSKLSSSTTVVVERRLASPWMPPLPAPKPSKQRARRRAPRQAADERRECTP